MKKAFVLILFFLIAAGAFPAEFKIVMGGTASKSSGPITLSDWGYIYTPRAEFGTGFVAGGGVEFSLAKNVVLEADALYLQKGSRIRYDLSGSTPVTARINELSLPVMIKILLRPGTSPYVTMGGEFALVLTEQPKDIDYGLVGGIGFQKKLGSSAVSLEARYHHGLHDLRPADIMFPDAAAIQRKMRVFVIMLGYTF
jgi:Outer membrane protein beta-barrel domain